MDSPLVATSRPGLTARHELATLVVRAAQIRRARPAAGPVGLGRGLRGDAPLIEEILKTFRFND
jgi:hypothetical protein